MANPLFNAMNNQPSGGFQMNPQISNLINMVKNGGNPNAMIMQMCQSNPQLQPLLGALKSGQNPEQLFYQVCKQKGINPQDILNQLK